MPANQLLPFFLAARSAAAPGKELLGEALCSSYEAFRHTRENNLHELDEQELLVPSPIIVDSTHSEWYLKEFDHALQFVTGATHPKIAATVQRVVDLWEQGEKVLVFAFYRQTCRALRIHISNEVERRTNELAKKRLADASSGDTDLPDRTVKELIDKIQSRFFDSSEGRPTSPGRRALDEALVQIVASKISGSSALTNAEQQELIDIMRRFLRVSTTLVRAFPIHQLDTISPQQAVETMLDHVDGSQVSWREKFAAFIDFFVRRCSNAEREGFIDAASRTTTGAIRIKVDGPSNTQSTDEQDDFVMTLANVQEATGLTDRAQRTD